MKEEERALQRGSDEGRINPLPSHPEQISVAASFTQEAMTRFVTLSDQREAEDLFWRQSICGPELKSIQDGLSKPMIDLDPDQARKLINVGLIVVVRIPKGLVVCRYIEGKQVFQEIVKPFTVETDMIIVDGKGEMMLPDGSGMEFPSTVLFLKPETK